jgi:hypothetical protein
MWAETQNSSLAQTNPFEKSRRCAWVECSAHTATDFTVIVRKWKLRSRMNERAIFNPKETAWT